ncbi:V-type proton ATPase 116 kDa subunit a, partial [Asbolus verrucosus]
MGDLIRSEEMVLCHLFIPSEAAYFVISELGEVGLLQFRDLNKNLQNFQRNFVRDVQMCYTMERRLRYIKSQVQESKIKIFTSPESAKARLSPNEITALKMQIKQAEIEIRRLTQNALDLKTYSLQLSEFKCVLQKAEEFLKKRDEIFGFDSTYKTSIDFLQVIGTDQLNFITGVVAKERVVAFETTLWRMSKGNAYFKREDIDEPLIDYTTGQKKYKTVFLVCCHGDKQFLKLLKLCEGFRASLYTCPTSHMERKRLIQSIDKRLDDLELVINQTDAYRRKFLFSVAQQLQHWTIMVRKIKAIYHTLNYMNMDVTGKCLIGECWVAVRDIPAVKQALADGSSSSISVSPFLYVVNTKELPPTYNKTNKYTKGFQNLIDVYGIATYREANPALYAIITFPFLFAVMFGDVGHALVMIIFALYLIRIEKKVEELQIRGEIFEIFFAGRYMILLMGLFSCYTGFIYNDIFSRPMNVFGSRWFVDFNRSTLAGNEDMELDPGVHYKGTPYVFGMDPAWGMKISIIIGVLHMILGLSLSIINYRHVNFHVTFNSDIRRYFNERHCIYLEYIPRLILLCTLFLWMVVMMFMKWIMFSASNTDVQFGTACAPSILVNFIDMMLVRRTTKAQFPGCNPYLFQNQPEVQMVLLLICALTIPVMLLGKPLYILYERKHHAKMSGMTDEASGQVVTENIEVNGKTTANEKPSETGSINAKDNDKNKAAGTDKTTANENPSETGSINARDNDKNKSVGADKTKEGTSDKKEAEEKENSESFGEIMILQVIDTIEYALGTVSHTASYLRLWALSLAHNELSEVLWGKLLSMGTANNGGYFGGLLMFLSFFMWMFFTVSILIIMEGLSAFLHTLRLHCN